MEIGEPVQNLRYHVIGGPFSVAVERRDEEAPMIRGELVDISASGVRLATTQPLRFGEDFVLHMESADLGLGTSITSCVQWIRPGRSEEGWLLGCTFEGELQPKILDELVERAILERRVSDRRDVSIMVDAEWERQSAVE